MCDGLPQGSFLLWKHSNGCAKLYTKFCLESVAISGNDQKWRCTIVYICKDTHVAPQLPNKYWLKSVPLHLHFTICNSVQWFCIIFLRFICQKWTSQTLQTIQLPVFTAYSVSIYTYIYIYILIAVNTSIDQPAAICSHHKHIFRCDCSLFWKKWPKFWYVWRPPTLIIWEHACRHSETMRVRSVCELHFSTRKYWTCSVSLICMPAHQSTHTTGLEYQDRNITTEKLLFHIYLAKTHSITHAKTFRIFHSACLLKRGGHQRAYLQSKEKLDLGLSRCVAKCVLKSNSALCWYVPQARSEVL